MMRRTYRFALPCALALATWGAAASGPGPLQVASPDWRDQIVYFALTDRFADGDARNNDQGAGEYAAGVRNRYNGGDLKGLRQRLDYIQGLGATALWITPPVANQWWDPQADYAGYHGYWAEHFKRVDRHLGTLADYRALSRALHGRGMFLVQDIVLNHTGNFFRYAGGWDPADPARFWQPNTGSRPVTRPTQPPFDRNDPRDPRQRREAIYHWTPDITDYADPKQESDGQMSGLDDLNTGNPVVRRALRDSYGWWIREAGIDAFRVDTAFYVPPEDVADFLYAKDARAPGIYEAARRSGRRDFLVFGEGFAIDKPFESVRAAKIERYATMAGGRPLMSGMLNFPLYGSLGDVFARGRPTAELAYRIAATMRVHARPHRMANFIDNHDVDRFLAGGSEAGLKQALLAMMTLPGIPVLYYGTEQGLKDSRASMFAAGWGSGGRDHYDTAAPLYRYAARLTALRRANPALSRGVPVVLKDNAAGAGVIAWRMDHEGDSLLVVLNSADHPALLDRLPTGARPGQVLESLFTIEGPPADLVAGAGGEVSLALPARAGAVWRLGRREAALLPVAGSVTLDGMPPSKVEGDFELAGEVRGTLPDLQLVVDGDLSTAQPVQPDTGGRWRVRVDTARMADAKQAHQAVLWSAAAGVASEAVRFKVERAWRTLAELEDPAGDDRGPNGRYRYPGDAGYTQAHPADIRRVRVAEAGGALRVEVQTNRIITPWNPPNGFDHVAFTVFIELPGQGGGVTAMPLQDATLPGGMRWHLRLRAHGWSNALFASEGADAANEGRPLTPAPAIEVDREASTVAFVLPASTPGLGRSLAGARVYVSTWDYDGGFRPLAEEGGANRFGGGRGGRDPKVMDDTAVIVLP